jgi:hypothetical protein
VSKSGGGSAWSSKYDVTAGMAKQSQGASARAQQSVLGTPGGSSNMLVPGARD